MNFLEETLEAMKELGILEEDILYIGSEEIELSLEQFKVLANIEYDSGFGSQKMPTDLLIYTSKAIFRREEYDGNEWWEYIKLEIPTGKKIKIKPNETFRTCEMWETLSEHLKDIKF